MYLTLNDMSETLAKLTKHQEQMIAYLDLKREEADWHAVWDAAMDIASLQDQLDGLYKLYKKANGIT